MGKKAKIIEYVLFSVVALILAYMLSPVDNSTQIVKQYNNISEKPSKSGGRKVNFLRTYTLTSGDNSLALNIGLSTDDVEALKNTDLLDGLKQSGSIVDSQYTSLNKLAQADALVNGVQYNNTHYRNALKIVNYNGVDFYYEAQGKSGAWASYKPYESSMKEAGCFYFAVAAAIGALNDEVCTVEQILTYLGADITVDEYGTFVVNNNPIDRLAGSADKVEDILTAKGIYDIKVDEYTNTRLNDVVALPDGSETNDITELESYGIYVDFQDLYSKISISDEFNNATDFDGQRQVIIGYAANRTSEPYEVVKDDGEIFHRSGSSSLLSSNTGTRSEGYDPPNFSDNYNSETGNHWFVIIGREGSDFVTLCLSSAELGRMSTQEFHYLKHVYVLTKQ